MNKKLVVKNVFNKKVYCVLSGDSSYEEQLKEVLSINSGYGFTVGFSEKEVKVMDYRTNEAVGCFEVLSFDDTAEDVALKWKDAE